MSLSLCAQKKVTKEMHPVTCPATRDTLRLKKRTGAAKLARLRRTQTVLALYPFSFSMLSYVTMGIFSDHIYNDLICSHDIP